LGVGRWNWSTQINRAGYRILKIKKQKRLGRVLYTLYAMKIWKIFVMCNVYKGEIWSKENQYFGQQIILVGCRQYDYFLGLLFALYYLIHQRSRMEENSVSR
jgi:hypothetical protein